MSRRLVAIATGAASGGILSSALIVSFQGAGWLGVAACVVVTIGGFALGRWWPR